MGKEEEFVDKSIEVFEKLIREIIEDKYPVNKIFKISNERRNEIMEKVITIHRLWYVTGESKEEIANGIIKSIKSRFNNKNEIAFALFSLLLILTIHTLYKHIISEIERLGKGGA